MKVIIRFDIPVEVHVDTKTGEVTQVDEWRSELWALNIWPVVVEAGTGNSIDRSIEEQAIELAEDADWPEWNIV